MPEVRTKPGLGESALQSVAGPAPDGQCVGKSDDIFQVLPGGHKITVELDGYAPETREIEIHEGRIARVRIELQKRAQVNARPIPQPDAGQGAAPETAPSGTPDPTQAIQDSADAEAASTFVSQDDFPASTQQAMLTVLRQHPTETRWSGRDGNTLFGVAVKRMPQTESRSRAVPAMLELVQMLAVHEVEILGGLSSEGKESIREALVNINLPKEEMTNISTESDESLRQAVDMMLRGFVIYEVKDDTSQNSVWVSIVTTPKTRGKFARPAPNALETENSRDGLNQVIAEVRSGLVPPVGGRIITMRATGETAFAGFGSAVVASSTNNAVQLRQNLAAQKIAAMRAKNALCGLIIGDKTSWEGSVVESMKDQVQEFESLDPNDPLARKDPTAVRKFEEARQTFVARMETSDTYLSARRRILPPGINIKTWFDSDNAWAYAMSVYVPSLTNAAAATGREMRESSILQPIDDSGRPSAAPGTG